MDISVASGSQDQGVILVNERIDENLKKEISTAILNLTFAQKKYLVILIDCTGGDVEIAMQLYDLIRSYPAESVGIVVGECSSSAMLLLQACRIRLALPHARFMCHTLRFTFRAAIAEESVDAFRKELCKRLELSKKFDELLRGGKISEETLRKLKSDGDNNELFYTATALECGFIDNEIDQIAPYIR